MGIKVAELTVDIHAGLDTFRSELEHGLQDTEAVDLPINAAVDNIEEDDLAKAYPDLFGKGDQDMKDEVAAEFAAGGLFALLAGGGGSGAMAAIVAATGLSAGTLTGIAIVVGALLAIAGVLVAFGAKTLQTAVANSKIVADINSYLNDTLGTLFDMLVIVIFAAIVGQLLPHVDDLKAFWEDSVVPFYQEIAPYLSSLLDASVGAATSFYEPMLSLVEGLIVPYLEVLLNYFSEYVLPLLEMGMGALEHIVAPYMTMLFDYLGIVLKPVFDHMNFVLTEYVGPFLREVNKVLNEDIWPFLDDYLMPAIALLVEISALIIAPLLSVIFNVLEAFLEPIFDVLEAVIGPAVKAIVWVLEPIFEFFVIPLLAAIVAILATINQRAEDADLSDDIETFMEGPEKKPGQPTFWEKLADMLGYESPASPTQDPMYIGGAARGAGGGGGQGSAGWYPGKMAKDTWDGISGGWW